MLSANDALQPCEDFCCAASKRPLFYPVAGALCLADASCVSQMEYRRVLALPPSCQRVEVRVPCFTQHASEHAEVRASFTQA